MIDGLFFSLFGLFGSSCFVCVGGQVGGGRTAPKNKANYINYFSDLLFMQIDHVLISVFVVSFVLLDICDL